AVATGGDQPAAVAAEGELMHWAGVSPAPGHRHIAIERPPAELRLPARRDEARAVGMDGHGQHLLIVTAVGALFFERARVEALDRPVLARGEQGAAVGRVSNRIDEVRV